MTGSMTFRITAMVGIQIIKEMWQALVTHHHELMWKTSQERRELAKERIAALNRGENPYLDLMDG